MDAKPSLPIPRRPQTPWRVRIACGIAWLAFLTVYALACVPGGSPRVDWNAQGHEVAESVEHGWPCVFFRRVASDKEHQALIDGYAFVDYHSAALNDPFPYEVPGWQVAERWQCVGENARFYPWAIAGNVAFAAAAMALIRFACAWQFRRNGALLRCSLRDLGVFVTLVAAFFGWCRHAMTVQEREMTAASAWLPEVHCVREYCGPRWMAGLVGAGRLPFWRITLVLIEQHGPIPDGVLLDDPRTEALFGSFRTLKQIGLHGDRITTGQILAALRIEGLEGLSITALPKLTEEIQLAIDQSRLRSLSIEGPLEAVDQVETLARFSSIERLSLRLGEQFPQPAWEVIAMLPKLETLAIYGESPDPRPLKSSKTLRRLSLYGAQVQRPLINALIELHELKEVAFLNSSGTNEALDRLRAARPDMQVKNSPLRLYSSSSSSSSDEFVLP